MWRQTRDVVYCAELCCVSTYSICQSVSCTHLSLLIFSLPINMPKKPYTQMCSTQSWGWWIANDLATTREIVLLTDTVCNNETGHLVSWLNQAGWCRSLTSSEWYWILTQRWFECLLEEVVTFRSSSDIGFLIQFDSHFIFLVWLDSYVSIPIHLKYISVKMSILLTYVRNYFSVNAENAVNYTGFWTGSVFLYFCLALIYFISSLVI